MATNQNNSASSPGTIIPFTLDGRLAFVVSDLHMAAGTNSNGNYEGTENFYYDQSFGRFLDHLQERVQDKGGLLIINGDFVDFTRITNVPKTGNDFRCWQESLTDAGLSKSLSELETSIVKKEKEYGLKTNDYKSVWKLYVSMEGHQYLFSRLAQWIREGNELIIVTGNHDLEWYWPAVQLYLRTKLEKLPIQHKDTVAQTKGIQSRIHFVNHALTLDNKVHIEHGHLYERTTAVVGAPTLNQGQELNYPFGSFFNRYLINRLELSYPFLDNVRPAQNILPILIRERFPLAVTVLFHYIPFMLLIIPKKLYWYTFKYFLNFFFIIILPILITGYAIYTSVRGGDANLNTEPQGLAKTALGILQNIGFLFLSYIFGRIMAMTGVKAPASFIGPAADIMRRNPSIEAVLFGHTHNPEQKQVSGNKWYFNTGTWIPVFETSSADVRIDKTYTFISINCSENPPCGERLQRWNDDAGRADSLIVNDKMN